MPRHYRIAAPATAPLPQVCDVLQRSRSPVVTGREQAVQEALIPLKSDVVRPREPPTR